MIVSGEAYDCDDRALAFAGLVSHSGGWWNLGCFVVYDYQNRHGYNLLMVSEDGKEIEFYRFDFEAGKKLEKAKLNYSCVIFGS